MKVIRLFRIKRFWILHWTKRTVWHISVILIFWLVCLKKGPWNHWTTSGDSEYLCQSFGTLAAGSVINYFVRCSLWLVTEPRRSSQGHFTLLQLISAFKTCKCIVPSFLRSLWQECRHQHWKQKQWEKAAKNLWAGGNIQRAQETKLL